MAYEDFQDLPRITAFGTVLGDKAFNIAKYPNMVDIQEVLLQFKAVYIFW